MNHEMKAGAIVGIILAAGRSERFGSPKQLLPLGETTVLGHVVTNANGSILDKVVVVLGRSASVIEKSLSFGEAKNTFPTDQPTIAAADPRNPFGPRQRSASLATLQKG